MSFLYQVILVSLTALILLAIQAEPLQVASLTQSEDFLARGTTKVLTGDYGRAISDLGQAIQNHPNDAKARMNHGLARAILGDKQGAIGDFNRALQIVLNLLRLTTTGGSCAPNSKTTKQRSRTLTRCCALIPRMRMLATAGG